MIESTEELQPTVVRLRLLDDRDAQGRPTRRILASPDPFMSFAGHPLIFASDSPFAIHFPDAFPLVGALEPLTRGHEWLQGFEGEHAHFLGQLVRADAAGVEYFKYTIAVSENGRVYIADPEGVFERDPRATDT